MIPFFSADGEHAAVIAVGVAPVGIIAIGVAPVGVISIGVFSSVGVVSFGAGLCFGIFSAGLGVACAPIAYAVGLAFGFRVRSTGAAWQVIPIGYPHAKPSSGPELVEPDSLVVGGRDGWVEVRVAGQPPHALLHRGRALDAAIADPALEALVPSLAGLRARARLRAVSVPTDASDYRSPNDGRRLQCLEVVRMEVPERPSRAGALVWWWTKVLLRGLGFFTVMLLAAGFAGTWVTAPPLDRQASVDWNATVRKSEGIYIPPESACRVHAAIRSDGQQRVKVDISVRCGELTLYDVQGRNDCSVQEVPATPVTDGFVYRLRCQVSEEHPDNGEGSPGLDLDTFAPRHVLLLTMRPPHPLYVELSVDETSAPRSGAPLFTP